MVSHRMLQYDVRCTACGKTSTVYIREDAGPPFDEIPRVTVASEGFRCALGPPIEFWCDDCGELGRRV